MSDALDARIAELDRDGCSCREISETLRAEGTPLEKTAVADRLRRLRGGGPSPTRAPRYAPAGPRDARAPLTRGQAEELIDVLRAYVDAAAPAEDAPPPEHAPPIAPDLPPLPIVHEITPETADLLSRCGRAYYEPPPGWTPPAPPWPDGLEPFTLEGVRHDIATNPRLAAGVTVAGSVVDAAWYTDDANGLEPPDVDLVLRALRHPYELARAVAHVTEYGEEREDGPAAKGEAVPLEEQLRAGLALLDAAAGELRAMAQRAAEQQTAKGYPCAFLTSCDGWRRSVVEGRGVCDEREGNTSDAPGTMEPGEAAPKSDAVPTSHAA